MKITEAEYISSRTNAQIKDAVRLGERSCRQEKGLFRFEGVKLLEEYISTNSKPEKLFVCENTADKNKTLIERAQALRLVLVSGTVFEKLSDEKSPEGLLCIAKPPENILFNRYNGGGILLESVRDSGNVGTIIRTALALGIKRLYISHDSADPLSQKTVKAAMGATFKLEIILCDALDVIKKHKSEGGRVLAAMPANGALALGKEKLSHDDMIIIGNEGNGVSRQARESSQALTIPMDNRSESLNAAVAASLIMWEISKNSL